MDLMRLPRILASLAPSAPLLTFATLFTACSDLGPKANWHTREYIIISPTTQSHSCAELAYEAPSGLEKNGEQVFIYIRPGQQCLALGYVPNGSLGSGDKRYLGPNGGASPAPRGYYVAGGVGSGGGALNLICPNVSAPYRCLTNATGQQIPTLYNRTELHGTWFDEGIGLCITWNTDGTSKGRNRGGIGGGPRDFPGQWGVIVNAKGEFQPTANQWYVFTTGLDAQTTLLTFDKTADPPRQIVGWAFRKASDGKCPW